MFLISHSVWHEPDGDLYSLLTPRYPINSLGGLFSQGTLTRPHAQEKARESHNTVCMFLDQQQGDSSWDKVVFTVGSILDYLDSKSK